ncbi:MAG TPA: helix-turn-helix transcriptional regulator [Syntrophomonadaceae bacterium]|nr:helix-turn-helix transcriptional regulator [Syntrophomonadaceae bacterium]
MNLFLNRYKNADPRSEWLGLTFAFVWFLCSMLSYYEPFFSKVQTVLIFMLLLCAGLAGAALLGEKRPELAGKILVFATVCGIICTGLIPFLPPIMAAAVFWLSALFMAPLLCRRLYGVLLTVRDSSRIRVYISAIAVALVVHFIWMQIPLPYTIRFPALSVLALLGLYGANAHLPEHKREELPRLAGFNTPVQLARMAAVFVLLVLINLFSTLIHAHVLLDSLNNNNLFSLATWATLPLSFLFFAYLSDLKKDRLGFIIGMALILTGCFAALAPQGSIMTVPLLLTGGFGGTISEFCFLTMPLLFFDFTKRPQLVAVSGLICHTLLSSAVSWTQDIWLPQALLREIDRPVIIFGAICVAAILPLALSVWKQYEDASLISALFGLNRSPQEQNDTSAPQMEKPPAPPEMRKLPAEDMDWIHYYDFLENEHSIALLLCEGLSRSEISERLGISAAQLSSHLHNMQKKLEEKPAVGQSPCIMEAAAQYGLTRRETEVFNELILGRSNAEIAANLYIGESTVKTHVNRIMKKTGMNSRAELIARLRADQDTSGSADKPLSLIHEK